MLRAHLTPADTRKVYQLTNRSSGGPSAKGQWLRALLFSCRRSIPPKPAAPPGKHFLTFRAISVDQCSSVAKMPLVCAAKLPFANCYLLECQISLSYNGFFARINSEMVHCGSRRKYYASVYTVQNSRSSATAVTAAAAVVFPITRSPDLQITRFIHFVIIIHVALTGVALSSRG